MKVRTIIAAIARRRVHRRLREQQSSSSSGTSSAATTSAAASSSSGASSSVHGLDRDRGPVHRPGRAARRSSSCTSRSSRSQKDNQANGTNITLVQGDTQLKPAQATTVDPAVHRELEDRRGRRTRRQPGGRGRRTAVRHAPGWRSSPARRRTAALTDGKNPTFFRVVSRRQRPGPAGRQLHRQPPASEGADDRRRPGGVLDRVWCRR